MNRTAQQNFRAAYRAARIASKQHSAAGWDSSPAYVALTARGDEWRLARSPLAERLAVSRMFALLERF